MSRMTRSGAPISSLNSAHTGSRIDVVEDPKREGVWPTTKRAWKRLWVTTGTHALVLQDDMLPCLGFYSLATAAIEANPSVPICFFTMRRMTLVEPARRAGLSWAAAPDVAIGGSTVMPMHLLEDFLKWEARNVDPAYPHDDGRLCLWAIDTKRLIWVTIPSLLQHVGDKSTLGHGGLDRTAGWYEDNPPDIDWTKGLYRPIVGKQMLGPVSRRD